MPRQRHWFGVRFGGKLGGGELGFVGWEREKERRERRERG